jgi:hypothetical protein
MIQKYLKVFLMLYPMYVIIAKIRTPKNSDFASGVEIRYANFFYYIIFTNLEL